MSDFVDYYELFGVSKDSSQQEIKRAYFKALKKFHPDVYSGLDAQDITAKLNVAYGILINDETRRIYDNQYDEYYNRSKKQYSDEEREYAKKLAIIKLIDEQIAGSKELLELKKSLFDKSVLNMDEREFKTLKDNCVDKINMCLFDLKKLLQLNSQYKLKKEEDIGYWIFKLEAQLKAIPNKISVVKDLIKIDEQLSNYRRFLDFRENIFSKVYLGNIDDREYKKEVSNWLYNVRNCIFNLNASLLMDKKYSYGKSRDIKELISKLELDVLKIPTKKSDADILVHIEDEILLYSSLRNFREFMIHKVYDNNLDVDGFEDEAAGWFNNVECGIEKLNLCLQMDVQYRLGKKDELNSLIRELELEKQDIYLNFSDYNISYRSFINGTILLKKIINKNSENLNKDELKFLYDLDYEARVPDCYKKVFEKIKNGREMKKDMAFIFDCDVENVLSSGDRSNNKVVVWLGDLCLRKDRAIELQNLKAVFGGIRVALFSELFPLKNLEYVTGSVNVPTRTEDLTYFQKLKYVGGDILWSGRLATGLNNLEYIGGDAKFGYLGSSKGFSHLKYIGGDADFTNLWDASYLSNLVEVVGCAGFSSLENSLGLDNLKYAGSVCFPELSDVSHLHNLHIVGGNAIFDELIDTTGLSNLVYVGGNVFFEKVKNACGLYQLKHIGLTAHFDSLTNPSGLESLKYIGGSAYFGELKKLVVLGDYGYFYRFFNVSRGLVSLETIKGQAFFSSNFNINELDNIEVDGDIVLGNKVYRR